MDETSYEVILLGATHVGKTTLFRKWKDIKEDLDVQPTIGIDFGCRNIRLSGEDGEIIVRLKLWDTAGQERFRSIVSKYFRVAQAVVVVYDTTSRESLEDARKWFEDSKKIIPDALYFLVGNKTDLPRRQVFAEDLMWFLDKGAVAFETNYQQRTLHILEKIAHLLHQSNIVSRSPETYKLEPHGCCLMA